MTTKQTIQHNNPDKRLWQGIPGLERTSRGRLFVSWFSGGPKEPDAANEVLLAASDDAGHTFSKPVVIAGPHGGSRAFDPVVWIDPAGRLWYFFNRGNKEAGEHTAHYRICEDPDAATPVWSEEAPIELGVPYCFRLNKPTVLSTGEWLLPVTHAGEKITEWFAREKQVQGVGISSDQGKSWRLHGAVKAPNWALECMTVELRNGKIWMLMRAAKECLWQSESQDRGRTWTEGTPTRIPGPGARFFIRRLASGSLLLVNHHQFDGRSHLTALLSQDDGETWGGGLLLDERKGVSYPDGVQDRDGLIWIAYDHDREGNGDILFATFREEDIAAGSNVSGDVRLRQLVSTLAPQEDAR